MVATQPFQLRHSLAVVLILALCLLGIERGAASVEGVEAGLYRIAGVASPICHSDMNGSTPVDPATPADHDCCDTCALFAAAVLPTPPIASRPASLISFAEHAFALAWVPHVARIRSPRLSQGPPSA